MSELELELKLIEFQEKSAWAQVQYSLACIDGNDPKERAWQNYLSDLGNLIRTLEEKRP